MLTFIFYIAGFGLIVPAWFYIVEHSETLQKLMDVILKEY